MWKWLIECIGPDRVAQRQSNGSSTGNEAWELQKTSDVDQSIDHQLKVLLTEYDILKKEIQSRSDYQHKLLQIHIGALAIILAAAVGDALSRWIILVVPFITAVFGLRWIDHSTSIRTIGQYIADHHEVYVDHLLGTNELMNWERLQRSPRSAPEQHRWRQSLWSPHNWTFMWPSLGVLGVAAAGALLTNPVARDIGMLSDVVEGFDHFFPMAAEYESIKSWVFLGVLVSGSIVIAQYWSRYVQYRRLLKRQLEGSSSAQ
jgi:hypothetical protein